MPNNMKKQYNFNITILGKIPKQTKETLLTFLPDKYNTNGYQEYVLKTKKTPYNANLQIFNLNPKKINPNNKTQLFLNFTQGASTIITINQNKKNIQTLEDYIQQQKNETNSYGYLTEPPIYNLKENNPTKLAHQLNQKLHNTIDTLVQQIEQEQNHTQPKKVNV